MSLISQAAILEVRALRRSLFARFVDADAFSPDRALEFPADSLSQDEQSLLADLVARGVVVEFRGSYYLDAERFSQEQRSSTFQLLISAVLLVFIVIATVVYFSGMSS